MKKLFISRATYGRPARVLDAIEEWNLDLSVDSRFDKYCKMAASPFVFFRGTAHLFWMDFSHDWRMGQFGNGQTRTWLQGDAHVENIGAFNNNQDQIAYGLNDFDESIIADYQYDVWRMAISIVLVARQFPTLSRAQQEHTVDAFAQSYLETVHAYHGTDKEDHLVFTKDNTYGALKDFLVSVETGKNHVKMLDKWTQVVDGIRRFDLSLKELEPATERERKEILAAMPQYGKTLFGQLSYDPSYFKVKDMARRLSAGTGSLGTPRFYILIDGASEDQDIDRILDIKRQSTPSAYDYLSKRERLAYDWTFTNNAERQAIAYLALSKFPDEHMGWMCLPNGFYSVRERSPAKATFPSAMLKDAEDFRMLAEQWGKVLATDHAYSDHDIAHALKAHAGKKLTSHQQDLLTLINHLTFTYEFDEEVTRVTQAQHEPFRALVRQVAFGYADQVQADWEHFVKDLAPKDCDEARGRNFKS